jgi:hypothetical protein
MLVDIEYRSDPITSIIAEVNGNPDSCVRHEKGVFEVGHFSLGNCIGKQLSFEQEYPELSINAYGVCDNYQQIIEQAPELSDEKRNFVISITKISKDKEPEEGGWRWHKWGPYIGEQESTTEYLYDEPEIDEVYVYHIYEL